MSNTLFHKNRYLELLQKEKALNNSDLCELEFKELLSYRVVLKDQITYNNRAKYISLLEEHINELFDSDFDNLDRYSAIVELSELFDQEVEDLDLLENQILKEGITILDHFPIDSISNSSEFSNWITDVVGCG